MLNQAICKHCRRSNGLVWDTGFKGSDLSQWEGGHIFCPSPSKRVTMFGIHGDPPEWCLHRFEQGVAAGLRRK